MTFAPMDAVVMDIVLSYFSKCAVWTTSLVGLIFLGRAVYLHITFSGSAAFGTLLKDTISYFVLILLFPKVVVIASELCTGLALKFSWQEPRSFSDSVSELAQAAQTSHWAVMMIVKLGPVFAAYLGQVIATVLLGVLIGVGPIMILLNTMWSIHGGTASYFKALAVLMLWPFCWNVLGALGSEVAAQQSMTSMMSLVFRASVAVLQLLTPLLSYSLMSTFSTSGAMQKAKAIIKAVPSPVQPSTVRFQKRSTKPPRFDPGAWI